MTGQNTTIPDATVARPQSPSTKTFGGKNAGRTEGKSFGRAVSDAVAKQKAKETNAADKETATENTLFGADDSQLAFAAVMPAMPENANTSPVHDLHNAIVTAIPTSLQKAPLLAALMQTAPLQDAPLQETSSQTAPLQATRTQAKPSQAAPLQAALTQAAPLQTVPLQTAPSQATLTQAEPLQAIPLQAAPSLNHLQTDPSQTALMHNTLTPGGGTLKWQGSILQTPVTVLNGGMEAKPQDVPLVTHTHGVSGQTEILSAKSSEAYKAASYTNGEALSAFGFHTADGGEKVSFKVGDPLNIHDARFPEKAAEKIIFARSRNMDRFDIELSPKELGKINISIVVKAGKTVVNMVCENARTQMLLDAHAQNIKEIIESSTGSRATVNTQQKDESMGREENFDGRGQRDSHQRQQQRQQQSNESEVFVQKLRLGMLVNT